MYHPGLNTASPTNQAAWRLRIIITILSPLHSSHLLLPENCLSVVKQFPAFTDMFIGVGHN